MGDFLKWAARGDTRKWVDVEPSKTWPPLSDMCTREQILGQHFSWGGTAEDLNERGAQQKEQFNLKKRRARRLYHKAIRLRYSHASEMSLAQFELQLEADDYAFNHGTMIIVG